MTTLNDLYAALVEFDKEPEVQDLYKRHVKYITDGDVRDTISTQLEVKLQWLLDRMAEVLTLPHTGKGNVDAWNDLRAKGFWVRHGGEDMAVLATNNISIAFDCMP